METSMNGIQIYASILWFFGAACHIYVAGKTAKPISLFDLLLNSLIQLPITGRIFGWW